MRKDLLSSIFWLSVGNPQLNPKLLVTKGLPLHPMSTVAAVSGKGNIYSLPLSKSGLTVDLLQSAPAILQSDPDLSDFPSPPCPQALSLAGTVGSPASHPHHIEAWHQLALAQHWHSPLPRCCKHALHNVLWYPKLAHEFTIRPTVEVLFIWNDQDKMRDHLEVILLTTGKVPLRKNFNKNWRRGISFALKLCLFALPCLLCVFDTSFKSF